MEQSMDIVAMEPHGFGVTITEGDTITGHRITVSPDFLDDAGLLGYDERELVRQSVAFLLERGPATAIRTEFDLAEIGVDYDEYVPELVQRMVP